MGKETEPEFKLIHEPGFFWHLSMDFPRDGTDFLGYYRHWLGAPEQVISHTLDPNPFTPQFSPVHKNGSLFATIPA